MDKDCSTIKYRLADGHVMSIEVAVSIKEALDSSDRQEQTQRRKERRYHVTLSPNEELDVSTTSPKDSIVDLLIAKDERSYMKSQLATLPSKQRRRLLLHFVHGLSYKEIAEIENVKVNSVCVAIKRALQHLRNNYNER